MNGFLIRLNVWTDCKCGQLNCPSVSFRCGCLVQVFPQDRGAAEEEVKHKDAALCLVLR